MTEQTKRNRHKLQEFEKRYQYDAQYLHDLADSSPSGFDAFSNFEAMAMYRKVLSVEVFFVAKIATAQTEGCGSCTELNVKMAREGGVGEEVLRGVLTGEGLSVQLEEVRKYAISVSSKSMDSGQVDQMRTQIGDEGLAELALCIASMRVYPCLKRAFGYEQNCILPPQ